MLIRITYQGKTFSLSASENDNLLKLIQSAGLPLGAPCGGKGVCKKCTVEIKGEGSKTACDYYIQAPIEVTIPDVPAMKILKESYFPDWTAHEKTIDSKAENLGFGFAVDVGTTTVVVFLEDLTKGRNLGSISFVNPQQSYGADVISRMAYCREHEDGLTTMQGVLVDQIKSAMTTLCDQHKIHPLEMTRMSVVGNTTMMHLFRGSDPSSMAEYPFTPVFLEETELSGETLNLEGFSNMVVTLLPSVSAYIGADIVAGIAAVDWPREDEYHLFLDIGTNGEMAVIGHDRIVTCATAAGPAFEGARISSGIGGVAGAINEFKPGYVKTIDNQPPIGLCGSGLVDAIAILLKEKVFDSSGFMEEEHTLIPANYKGSHPSISLTPQDIREVQLAKGAIAAGIEILMNRGIAPWSWESGIKKVFLAGGFGYALHPDSAAKIGLIPPLLTNRVIQVGNTAGLGARLFLHSPEYRIRLKLALEKMEYIDLSGDEKFNDLFVLRMGFV